jgi:putative hemolysin
MTSLSCLVVNSKRQLDDALRVRWAVFVEELRLIDGPGPAAPREVNCFDTLETTTHLVVYAGSRPVATSRLLLPNPEVSAATRGHLGIDLEQKLELSGLRGSGMSLAESTRFCVMKDYRCFDVLVRLEAGLYQESRRLGVTHWIASANTETDSSEDAQLLFLVVDHRGLVHPRWRVRAHEPSKPPEVPSTPLYTPEERELARLGWLDSLKLPKPLWLFANKMGARFIGEPIFDTHFRRYSIPLIAALDEVPASTLELFNALDSGVLSAA